MLTSLRFLENKDYGITVLKKSFNIIIIEFNYNINCNYKIVTMIT